MARIRSVKPELRTSAIVRSWPIEVRYFWVLLWGYLDDYGRGRDLPKTIAGDCFPTDDRFTAAVIDKWLTLMTVGLTPDEDGGPLCRYLVDGSAYVHCVNWREHQKPNRPTPSRLPPCPIHDKPRDRLTEPPHASSREPLTESPYGGSVPGAAEQQRRGAEEQQQTRREPLPATATQPAAAAAAKIILENLETQGCTPAEAGTLAARIAADKRPRNLGGLVRTLARDGDLAEMLADLRNTQTGVDNLAAIEAARRGPRCRHDEPGGAELHPVSREPLCALCRLERKRATP